jgi:hypothetical protein
MSPFVRTRVAACPRRLVFLAGLVMGVIAATGTWRPTAEGAPHTSGTTVFLSLLSAAPAGDVTEGSVQARLAQRRTLFDMLLADGRILDYRVHLGDGIVAVDVTPGGLAALRAAFGADILPSDASGVAEQTKRATVFRRAAGEAPDPTLTANVTLGDSSVFGVAPAEKKVVGRLVDANGNVISTASDKAEGGTYNFFFGRFESVPVLAGYKVKIQVGVRQLTLSVPKLTVGANRRSDVISGVAPRNAGVFITATHFAWTEEGPEQESFSLSALSDTKSEYSFDATAFVDLVGGDSVSAKLKLAGGAGEVTANATVPYFVGYLDRARVSGFGNPSTPATLTIIDRLKRAIFAMTFRTNLSGAFNVFLTDGAVSVTLQPKMTVNVRFVGAASAILPQVTGMLDVAGHAVRGKGPPNQFLRIQTQQPFYTHYGKIDARGRFEIDIGSGGSVSEGTLVAVVVRLSAGDLVFRYIE